MSNPGEGIEILVPYVSDAVFKYVWHIKKYGKINRKKDSFDSEPFEFNANGEKTRWSLSIRFWKGAEGKRLNNPVVLCLNLLRSEVRNPGQVTITFQFGIYNETAKQWETCQTSRTVVNMPSSELMSIGYRDLHVHDRHMEPKSKTMNVFVKIQLTFTDIEVNNLNQDLSRLLKDAWTTGDVVVRCAQNRTLKAHKCILIARSPVFAEMLRTSEDLDLSNISEEVVRELFRYIYTDHIDDLGANSSVLLSVAMRFDLPGLKSMCERFLLDSIKPESVPTLLLLADQFNCESLKNAVMLYCEGHSNSIQKTMAWKVLEMVNPELFVEVCEAGLGSSISSNLDSDPDPNDPDLA